MVLVPNERTGIMIVRLWLEANHASGLRARITQTIDTTTSERSVAVAASTDDIREAVKGWVDEFFIEHDLQIQTATGQ